MKKLDIVEEMKAFLAKIYGPGWENDPSCPDTDEVSGLTHHNALMLARGTNKPELFREIALIQLVGAFLAEFRGRGPNFPLTESNPRLAALIVSPPTLADAIKWHIDHPGYEGGDQLKKLEPLMRRNWKILRPRLLS